jgi:hypothetical protein
MRQSRTYDTQPARLLKRTGNHVRFDLGIEAIVCARLGWPPMAASAQEAAETAAIVGYAPGLASQITCSE